MMTHLEINLNFNDLDYCVCLFVKPLWGGHWGLRYCGIGQFFMRYFGNFNFKLRYCGVLRICGMRYFWRFGQRYLIKKKLFYTVSDPFLVWLVSDRLGNSGNKLKDAVVEKCWRAYGTPAIRKLFENLCLQSLALTKVSFIDFPLRYDSMGCSWNISFRCGWFWIRRHFPISIFLTLGKAGWYCVTKGNIFFFVLLSLFSRDLWS